MTIDSQGNIRPTYRSLARAGVMVTGPITIGPITIGNRPDRVRTKAEAYVPPPRSPQ